MNLEFTDNARADLMEIWVHNAELYSIEHADKYREFLILEIQRLTTVPELGNAVPEFPGLRRLVIKRRASGHGHSAFYEIQPDRIRVVRILHTAMFAPDHI